MATRLPEHLQKFLRGNGASEVKMILRRLYMLLVENSRSCDFKILLLRHFILIELSEHLREDCTFLGFNQFCFRIRHEVRGEELSWLRRPYQVIVGGKNEIAS